MVPKRPFFLPKGRRTNQGSSGERLRRLRDSRLAPSIPIGVNLGKSKITPLEEAPADYLQSFQRLAPVADYIVLNVSSPNTPGLRNLQQAAALDDLLAKVIDAVKDVLPNS